MSGERDVHSAHCCYKHGCKYGDDRQELQSCPVVNGTVKQNAPCEECYEGIEVREETEGQVHAHPVEKPSRFFDAKKLVGFKPERMEVKDKTFFPKWDEGPCGSSAEVLGGLVELWVHKPDAKREEWVSEISGWKVFKFKGCATKEEAKQKVLFELQKILQKCGLIR